MTKSKSGRRGKVAKLLVEHEQEDFGDELVEQWTTNDTVARKSLRELARDFNIRLLEWHLSEAEETLIQGEAENLYDTLGGEEGSRGERTQVRRLLEQRGVDVDELESEFVSRQAIHTYLTKNRDVGHTGSGASVTVDGVRETISRLRERTNKVVASKITRLREADLLTIGEFQVIVDIQIYCTDCGAQLGVTELLGEGKCHCDL